MEGRFGRPPHYEDRTQLMIYTEKKRLKSVKILAAKTGRTLSALVNEALDQYLTKQNGATILPDHIEDRGYVFKSSSPIDLAH